MRVQEDALRHVLGYVGPNMYIFMAPVCRQWKRQYQQVHHGRKEKNTSLRSVVSSLSTLLMYDKEIRTIMPSYRSLSLDRAIGKNGNLQMARWLHARNRLQLSLHLIDGAASGGHLDMVEWLIGRECWPADTTCSAAAEGGHLEVLKFIRTIIGCDWCFDEYTCAGAAKGGHLVVLKWLRANGCPWDDRTCEAAAEKGYLNLLKWARTNGCDYDGAACCYYAALGGQLEVLKWAVANGSQWSPGECLEVAYNEYEFEVLEWIKQKVDYHPDFAEYWS